VELLQLINGLSGITLLCCGPLVILGSLITILLKAWSLVEEKQDKPTIISKIWYRTFLLTPKSIALIFFSLFTIWLATISIDLAIFSTVGIFFILIIALLWIYAQIINLYLFIKSRLENGLITSRTNYRIIQVSETIKQDLNIRLPQPIGLVLKLRAIMPNRLGEDFKQVGYSSKSLKSPEIGQQSVEIIPEYSKRGVYNLGPIIAEYTDMFGLTAIIYTYYPKETITIFPKLRRLNKLAIQSYSPKIGDESELKKIINNSEYFDAKQYVRGDDVRHIHWKLTAKSDELMLRKAEITEITRGEVIIIIDNTIPSYAHSRNFTDILGSYDLLDKMVDAALSLADYSLRTKTSLKLVYYISPTEFEVIKINVARREELLQRLAKLDWVYKSNLQFSLFPISQLAKNNSCYYLTAEINIPILTQINSMVKLCAANLIYFPLYSYLLPKAENRKLSVAKIFLTDSGYGQQKTLVQYISSYLTKKNNYLPLNRQGEMGMLGNLSEQYAIENFVDVRLVYKKDDYIKLLEQS